MEEGGAYPSVIFNNIISDWCSLTGKTKCMVIESPTS